MRLSEALAKQRAGKQDEQAARRRLAEHALRRSRWAKKIAAGGTDKHGTVHPPGIFWWKKKEYWDRNDWCFRLIVDKRGTPIEPLNFWISFLCKPCSRFIYTFECFSVDCNGVHICGQCKDSFMIQDSKKNRQRILAKKKPYSDLQARVVDFIGMGHKTHTEVMNALGLSEKTAIQVLQSLNKMGDLSVVGCDNKGLGGTWSLRSQ